MKKQLLLANYVFQANFLTSLVKLGVPLLLSCGVPPLFRDVPSLKFITVSVEIFVGQSHGLAVMLRFYYSNYLPDCQGKAGLFAIGGFDFHTLDKGGE